MVMMEGSKLCNPIVKRDDLGGGTLGGRLLEKGDGWFLVEFMMVLFGRVVLLLNVLVVVLLEEAGVMMDVSTFILDPRR